MWTSVNNEHESSLEITKGTELFQGTTWHEEVNNFKYHLICRSIKERAESVSKKIGEKLTPEIKKCLDNALTMEEVEEVVSLQST